ncbi:hypothetical protein CYLTODRAFT_491571 [Cylindrobasidium torrendii FP15055 ss-10]|uniref:Endopeptidase S2P n=1 Tax=Cylindrobasidium torrendii FP15055 ss-10 TaxID=1314674 RepID=A0A0D7B776_9AGAR|nr:hypothetical protein CYLTODRAFT_491571 [Cylindrobasidium torrendii FP15055 ss-10]
MLLYSTALFLVFWTIIHLLVRQYSKNNSNAILPTLANPRSRKTNISVQYLHLKVETTTWNALHDSLASAILKRRYQRYKSFLHAFYDAGILVGVLGMFCALGLIFYTLFSAMQTAFLATVSSPSPRNLLKRATSAAIEQSSNYIVQPIIPGVTVPLSHFFPIVASLLFGQVIHEAGHAIAGAVESLPMQSCGLSLLAFLPSAFVAFPSHAIGALDPRSRARVIAAGAWHNAVLWLALLGIGWLKLSYHILTLVAYEDISNAGRVVVSVGAQSSLKGYLSPGAVITALDDTSLSGGGEPWTEYLTTPVVPVSTGWCTPSRAFFDAPKTCCLPRASISLDSCFKSISGSDRACIDAVPLLTSSNKTTRCQSDAECGDDGTCIRPDENAKLLRITMLEYIRGEDPEIILWRGDKEEIWETVTVDILRPRLQIFPSWLPGVVFLFESYMQTITLSLFLLNLLPLPFLDGSQFLYTLLELGWRPPAYDMAAEALDVDALERGNTRDL